MKRILVTGACGSIGSALVSKLISTGNIVCAFDNNEDKLFHLNKKINNVNLKIFIGDIRDKDRLIQSLNGVEDVYHCAAFKHVELSEYNPFEALKTNVIGTQNIIEASLQQQIKKLILTSSDKAVNPSGIMGATKLLSEKLIINSNSYSGKDTIKMGCVRFGNVWNTNGSFGPIFKNQIKNNLNINLTDKEMTRFFISIEDAIELCINACSNLIGGEIFVLDMGSASIGSIAREFIKFNTSSKIIEIGAKAGEKLYEELFTEVESKRTYLYDDMYVIIPDSLDKSSSRYKKLKQKYENKKPVSKALRSDSTGSKKIDVSGFVNEIMNEI